MIQPRFTHKLLLATKAAEKVGLALALLSFLPFAPAVYGQATVAVTAFPTEDVTDGRFLSLVNSTTIGGLTAGNTSLRVTAPPNRTEFSFRIFDGDTGKSCLSSPTCCNTSLGHWDQGSTQIVVRMYFDPLQIANESPADLVGEWFGHASNITVDPNGRWIADAQMPDNDWWNLQVQVTPEAVGAGGIAAYHLTIELESMTANTVSNFKVATDASLAVLVSTFGIEAGLGGSVNDLAVLYPGLDCNNLPTAPDFYVVNPTTYDGSFSFFLDVTQSLETLEIFNGDFDFGTSDAVGVPSGVAFAPCADSDDPDSPDFPPFPSPNAVMQAAQGAGAPQDDNAFDALRRSPCVTITVTDPSGIAYQDFDVSGDTEWERFAITSDPFVAADYGPNDAADGVNFVTTPLLPAGAWEVRVDGLDIGNSGFWRFEQTAFTCPCDEGLLQDQEFDSDSDPDFDSDSDSDSDFLVPERCRIPIVDSDRYDDSDSDSDHDSDSDSDFLIRGCFIAPDPGGDSDSDSD